MMKKAFEKMVGNGENPDDWHFLFFAQCFPPYQEQNSPFEQVIICDLQML